MNCTNKGTHLFRKFTATYTDGISNTELLRTFYIWTYTRDVGDNSMGTTCATVAVTLLSGRPIADGPTKAEAVFPSLHMDTTLFSWVDWDGCGDVKQLLQQRGKDR